MVWRSKEEDVKFIIDWIAIYLAIAVTREASGSWLLAIVAGVFVGGYGLWCFYAGIGRSRQ